MRYDNIQVNYEVSLRIDDKWFLLFFNVVWKWIDIKKETDLSNWVGSMLIIRQC